MRPTAAIQRTINLFTTCFLDNASVSLGSAEERHFVNCLLGYDHREDFKLTAHVLELGSVHLHEGALLAAARVAGLRSHLQIAHGDAPREHLEDYSN